MWKYKARCLLTPLVYNIGLRAPVSARKLKKKGKKEKERKKLKNIEIINTGKKEAKLLTDDMIIYVKNSKKSTKTSTRTW